ncbi:GAF and ANTAR domain-containing protein [Streptomyces sp. ODS28]|uniref:GAF and ANTAR domain-containing protein n=1 Tax=Streptomyces sp. ODS28 TaxID=3136688 RepID=UPI0031ED3142
MTRDERLAATFAEMTDALVDDFDIIDFLQRLAGHCVELLDAGSAALMLADPWETLWTVAASDARAQRLGSAARQLSEGPCVASYRSGARAADEDLALGDARWPAFARQAAELGVRGGVALPLRLRGQAIGALGLFRSAPGPFAAEELQLAQALADSATVGLLQQRAPDGAEAIVAQLRATFGSWVVVEQAKGMLAELWNVTPEEALTALRERARTRGTLLTDLANGVLHGRIAPEHLRAPRTDA